MLRRLETAIDSGDLKVINMHMEGDGPQILELFARPVEKVLRELIADMRLAGHQHFAFHEYKDPHGTSNRLFAGDANGSVSFNCTLCPTGHMGYTRLHKAVSLVFFSTFEPMWRYGRTFPRQISVDQAVELRKKRVQESRARARHGAAETLQRRRDESWANRTSAPQ
jgi:hypothetical protein